MDRVPATPDIAIADIARSDADDQVALDELMRAFNKLHEETGLLSDEYPCF